MGKWLERFLPETGQPRTDTLDVLGSVSRVAGRDTPALEGFLPWDAERWREHYAERIAVAADGKPDDAVKGQARDECIDLWLRHHHDEHASPDTCPHCGESTGAALTYANPGGWPLHIHDDCIKAWAEKRRKDADTALKNMGIKL